MNKELMFSSESDEWKKILKKINNKIIINNECYEWQGALDKDNYGVIWFNNKSWRVHRLIWVIYNGNIPKEMCICHKCDNPKCININHLFIGTTQENTKDRDNKNRQAKWDKHIFTKLNPIQIKEIKKLHFEDGISYRKLAEKYNVCYATIREATIGRNWKHVK